MKKLFFVIFAMFLSMGMFNSCEKEDSTQVLSEFIVGGHWVYTEVDTEDLTHISTTYFHADFYQNGEYKLTITEGLQFMTINGTYTIDDALNELTITNPFYDERKGESNEPEFNTFSVEWQEDIEEMYWTAPDMHEDDILKWERTYEE